MNLSVIPVVRYSKFFGNPEKTTFNCNALNAVVKPRKKFFPPRLGLGWKVPVQKAQPVADVPSGVIARPAPPLEVVAEIK